ncbi:crossover junction endodeoxyribonuclease RuvC [Winkia sp. ACRQY]|uniref:Crossover junction endodeoxyribonuclease RuvC n=1 Tax=Winkia neuii subsp. anitrata TaxID=29318 RepID=A0AB38XLW9_9ACTO|nr:MULTISPECIES: crossover junction endodeoxyribonuclease RuvC [Winkia]MCG7301859.1 crossover junction endodeoxyribonuclease RuvC [Winkia sp. ACRQY]MDK7162598.1 crossover junction endodeoxyribonuclease RuvC [Winkia sp. UMB3105]MDK8594167.1 crossover junction endodeoxyribonuclease RuvC [Winkia sp. UMB1096A]MDU2268828.1 crossover junction endodeoxyribonuclease RuvC [Winkia neuii]WCE45179.1 crossover junction endodeoxyribonuclease RuvC [Winkia neuii subsp. anitrata]
MRIMGIDPGITRCGLGVIDTNTDRTASLVYVGVARTQASLAQHFRLRTIGREIARVISTFDPQIVAIERVFAQENLQSVTTTMQVMGVAMYQVAEAGLPLAIHTPSEVKSAVTGSGIAGKAQVQEMVKRILGLDKVVRPADAADALAIAITQSWRGTGLAGGSDDSTVSVSLSGKVSARNKLTPAQEQWAKAQAAFRRTGAVDPRKRRSKRS